METSKLLPTGVIPGKLTLIRVVLITIGTITVQVLPESVIVNLHSIVEHDVG